MAVKHHFLFLFPLVAILAAYAGTKAALQIRHNSQSPALAAQKLAEVYFYDKSDRQITLEEFRGKVVLVNLWATWCTPCLAEMPSLDRLQQKLGERGFQVVALSLDKSSLGAIQGFLQKAGVAHLDAYWDKDRQVPLKWKYEGLPTSYLISREGKVLSRYDGPFEWDKEPLVSEISSLLQK